MLFLGYLLLTVPGTSSPYSLASAHAEAASLGFLSLFLSLPFDAFSPLTPRVTHSVSLILVGL